MRPGFKTTRHRSTWSRENEIDASIAEFSLKHKRCHNLPYIPDAELSNDTDKRLTLI